MIGGVHLFTRSLARSLIVHAWTASSPAAGRQRAMELARRPPTWGSNQSREAIHQIIPISPTHAAVATNEPDHIIPRFIDQRSIERERAAGRQREALVGGCPEAGRHRARGHPCRPAAAGVWCGPRTSPARRSATDLHACPLATGCVHSSLVHGQVVCSCLPLAAAAFCANAGRPVPCMEAN